MKNSIGLVVTAVAMTSVISGLHATTALANPGSADLIERMAGDISAEAVSVEVRDTSKSTIEARHIQPMATDVSIKDFVAKEKAMADSVLNVGGEAMNRRGRRTSDDDFKANYADVENVNSALESAKKLEMSAKIVVDDLKTDSYSVDIQKGATEAAAAEMTAAAKGAADAAMQQAAALAAAEAAEQAAAQVTAQIAAQAAAQLAAAEAAAQAAAQAAAEAAAEAAAQAAAQAAAEAAAEAAAQAAAQAAAEAAAEAAAKEAAEAAAKELVAEEVVEIKGKGVIGKK